MLRLLLEKIENAMFVVIVFHEWQNPELLRGYPYFRNALLILRNKYGRAVMVGMYAILPLPSSTHKASGTRAAMENGPLMWLGVEVSE